MHCRYKNAQRGGSDVTAQFLRTQLSGLQRVRDIVAIKGLGAAIAFCA
jgi:hypothetical protein